MVRLGLSARVAVVVGLGFALACGGATGGAPCCTVDDIFDLHARGVSDAVIVDAIRTSGTDLALTADELARLDAAGVSPEVIDALNGGPCVCEPVDGVPVEPAPAGGSDTDPSPAPVPTASGRGIDVTVMYSGGKNFELVNRSEVPYTNLVLIANDDWEYQVARLPPNTGQFVRLASFVSRTDGSDGKGMTLQKIVVQADQGSYLRTF